MGNKTNANTLRKRFTPSYSNWFAFKTDDYRENLHREFSIRDFLKKTVDQKIVSRIFIFFEGNQKEKVRISLQTSRPGAIIGKQGAEIEKLKESIKKLSEKNSQVSIDVVEIANQDLDPALVASRICTGITQRQSAKRLMKSAILKSMSSGARGIKIICSGRHGGEIARDEKVHAGSVSSQTLSENIFFHQMQAPTTMGTMGVKVWISLPPKQRYNIAAKLKNTREGRPKRNFQNKNTVRE
jgi:small subunit ribosomal protein S3